MDSIIELFAKSIRSSSIKKSKQKSIIKSSRQKKQPLLNREYSKIKVSEKALNVTNLFEKKQQQQQQKDTCKIIFNDHKEEQKSVAVDEYVFKFENGNIYNCKDNQASIQFVGKKCFPLLYDEAQKEYKTFQETIQKKDSFKILGLLDQLNTKSPSTTLLLCNQIMSQPQSFQNVKQSQILKEKIEEKSQKKESIETTMMLLSQVFKTQENQIFFTQKSTASSQITMKMLTQGFFSNAVVIQQTLPQQIPFSHLEDRTNFQNYIQNHRRLLKKYTKLDTDKIVYSAITKGSIKIRWMTSEGKQIVNGQLQKYKDSRANVKLKLHPYFQKFTISPEDFAWQGNMSFQGLYHAQDRNKKIQPERKKYYKNVQRRGGWPYYQPVDCKRYGINVWDKYDNGDNRWLTMQNEEGEWAVAYHGVRKPFNLCPGNDKKVLESMFQGLDRGQMMRSGANQAFQYDPAVNRPNTELCQGIYCTPHIQFALGYAESTKINVNGIEETYYLVLQCRLNPYKIKVGTDNSVWVVNQSKDIRPYGIILVKQQTKNKYQGCFSALNLFKQTFKWEKYKEQLIRFSQQKQNQIENHRVNLQCQTTQIKQQIM